MADDLTPHVSDDVIEAPSPTDERPACRICLQPASADAALVELGCRCVDAFVHDACAQRWYAMRGSNVCEVCKVSTELDVSSRDGFVASASNGVLCRLFRLGDDDEAGEFGPSVGDIVRAFVVLHLSVTTSMVVLHEFDALVSLWMSLCFSFSVLISLIFWRFPLRRARVPRHESRIFSWIFVLSAFGAHQIAFSLSLGSIRDHSARIKHASSMTFGLCVAALAYPQLALGVGFLCRTLNRDWDG